MDYRRLPIGRSFSTITAKGTNNGAQMTANKTLMAIGLMSGTSMDGIDAAVVSTDGRRIAGLGPSLSVPYEAAFRTRLRAQLGRSEPPGEIEREITLLHARAVKDLLDQAGMTAAEIDVIGFHGHTIIHDPENRRTRQIGDGPLLAEQTGIDVIGDFRARDVAAGGQGAPLAPLLHLALSVDLERPLVVLNLGGVANVTWIGAGPGSEAEAALIAFDTGPGNALIDDWMLARQGRVDENLLAELLAHSYFRRPPPKSIDRDLFDGSRLEGLSDADGAATLSALSARSIALAKQFFPAAPPSAWLVTGGGRKNPVLMGMLGELLALPVRPVEAVGWDGDMIEAQAFAYLAVRSLWQLPISLPGTTGVPAPLTGGVLHPAPT